MQRYRDLIESADRTRPTGFDVKTVRLYENIACLRQQMRELAQIRKQSGKQPDKQLSMTDPDSRSTATREEKRFRHSWLQRSGSHRHETSPEGTVPPIAAAGKGRPHEKTGVRRDRSGRSSHYGGDSSIGES